jgi:polyisoprenoid-binding protein YceI
MKKVLFSLFFLGMSVSASFAQKYMTRTGKIYFDATSKTSPEKITAVNNEVASVLDAANGRVLFQALVKSFKFEKELMEEHFNENYMESDKFPKAGFEGAITNLNEINFTKDGTYNAKVKGKLQIHGETQDVEETGNVIVNGSSLTLKAKFTVKLADYKVSIPQLVADKVNKEAVISVESVLSKK